MALKKRSTKTMPNTKESSAISTGTFVGDRHRPLLPQELAERRPILGTGKMPEELLAMRRRQSLFLAGESSKKPEIVVTRIDRPRDESGQAGWRVDIKMDEDPYKAALPMVRAKREAAEVFRKGIASSVDYSGRRPEWMDLLYVPRVLPQPSHPLIRRINGRFTRPLWVFDSDDRRIYRDTSYPWGCIGKITSQYGLPGSGVLVGRYLVATAGHLVPWDLGGWIKFVPDDYIGGGSLYGQSVFSYAVEARGYNTSVTGYDWALLRLSEPLGDMIGYMGYNSYSDDWEGQFCWTVVGYPSGVGPYWQDGIDINDDDEDSNDGQEFESVTADVSGGNSGGPIFGWWNDDPRIIGVVSGEETEMVGLRSHQDNVFAGGPGLYNLIAWGRSNWESELLVGIILGL